MPELAAPPADRDCAPPACGAFAPEPEALCAPLVGPPDAELAEEDELPDLLDDELCFDALSFDEEEDGEPDDELGLLGELGELDGLLGDEGCGIVGEEGCVCGRVQAASARLAAAPSIS